MYEKSYDNLEFVKQKAIEFLETTKSDTLPGCRILRSKGYKNLAYAIERKHGGIVKIRELLNAPQLRVKRGTWRKLEFRIAMAKIAMIISESDTLPCRSRLDKIGFSSLSYSISRYDKGFSNFRRILDEDEDENKKRIRKYQDINYGIEIANQIKKEHGFSRLPNDKKLRELGYSTLTHYIYEKYGGRKKFRQILGETENTRERGALKNIDYVAEEIRKLMHLHGLTHFPTKNHLSELDSSLAYAIVKYFGYPSFRERFELKMTS